MNMHRLKNSFLVAVFILLESANALEIPAKFDGFVYKHKGQTSEESSIVMEAFFDPVCPDSRDAWPPLKKALQHYGSLIKLTVHPFPLPYHDNSFVTSRALHIVNHLNDSATYHMLELFFKNQEKLYNAPTHDMSRAAVVKHVAKLVVKAVGGSSLSAIESGFNDTKTDHATRTSFKYGCTRGVFGTPFFFVNGFALPDAGSALDYNGWRKILDPLVGKQSQERVDSFHFFLTSLCIALPLVFGVTQARTRARHPLVLLKLEKIPGIGQTKERFRNEEELCKRFGGLFCTTDKEIRLDSWWTFI